MSRTRTPRRSRSSCARVDIARAGRVAAAAVAVRLQALVAGRVVVAGATNRASRCAKRNRAGHLSLSLSPAHRSPVLLSRHRNDAAAVVVAVEAVVVVGVAAAAAVVAEAVAHAAPATQDAASRKR